MGSWAYPHSLMNLQVIFTYRVCLAQLGMLQTVHNDLLTIDAEIYKTRISTTYHKS
jgi:hypothetical protein